MLGLRELLLSSDGIDLADVYEHGSEVLMGTARETRAREDVAAKKRRHLKHKQRLLAIEQRLEQVERERQSLSAELELERDEAAETDRLQSLQRQKIKQRRDPGRGNPSKTTIGDEGEQS